MQNPCVSGRIPLGKVEDAMKKPSCKLAWLSVLAWSSPIASLAAPASAPPASSVPAAGSDGVLLAFAVPVLAVVFAMLALWWLVRRFAVARGGSGPMRVSQALAVGPRERIVLVETHDKHLVVGVTPAAVTLLTQWDKPQTESTTTAPTASST
jgi:flagellar protein FliO/FliZ